MVITFETTDGVARFLEASANMAEASSRLPHGAYTTLRTYGGRRVVRLGQHARRLEESIRLQGLQASIDEAELRRALAEALQATGHPESRLRVSFAPPRLFVSVEPFEPLPEALYRDGVACVTLPLRRVDPRSKDTRFLADSGAAYGRLPAGVHEGLMVGDDGAILEGLSSNFFAVREGTLHTEEAKALPGVTRSLVLEVAHGLVRCSGVALRTAQLGELSECFITSVSRGILPVARIDGAVIGGGNPGPVTGELARRFSELVEREAVEVFS